MKKIDISTQEGLDKLKAKAKTFGHYAEFLQVLELIEEIEKHRIEIGLLFALSSQNSVSDTHHE